MMILINLKIIILIMASKVKLIILELV